MYKCVTWLMAIGFAALMTVHAEETCPADRAGRQGFEPFEEFHQVMAPAWHQAWPAKDYEALFSAGDEFSTLFKRIAFLKPQFKTEDRRQAFLEHRADFAQLVREYHQACRDQDSSAVIEIMPRLHDAFEATASTLLPVFYPEFEGFVVTLNLIIETHLPDENMDGLTGSTETLVRKAEGLDAETVPSELSSVRAEVVKRQDRLRTLSHELSRALAEDDMAAFKSTLSVLEGEVQKFIADFL